MVSTIPVCAPERRTSQSGPITSCSSRPDRFAVMDKCGTTLLTDTFRHFLNQSATASQYTPRAIYDAWDNRWIVVLISTETNYSVSTVLVMYTEGPDPTGTWHLYSFASPTVAGLKDLSGVSVGPFSVYLTWDQYNLSTFVFQTAVICEMDKQDFYNAGSTSFYFKTGMTNRVMRRSRFPCAPRSSTRILGTRSSSPAR
jgi:hypothetical protein